MAHFAQLDENNNVINVIVIADEDTSINGVEKEEIGIQFCQSLFPNTIWKKTSYNTFAGQHAYDKEPLRKNYAAIGMTYDPVRDAFIPPKPYNSWVLVESTCQWEPPIKHNVDGKSYSWDEDLLNWVEVTPVVTIP